MTVHFSPRSWSLGFERATYAEAWQLRLGPNAISGKPADAAVE